MKKSILNVLAYHQDFHYFIVNQTFIRIHFELHCLSCFHRNCIAMFYIIVYGTNTGFFSIFIAVSKVAVRDHPPATTDHSEVFRRK